MLFNTKIKISGEKTIDLIFSKRVRTAVKANVATNRHDSRQNNDNGRQTLFSRDMLDHIVIMFLKDSTTEMS